MARLKTHELKPEHGGNYVCRACDPAVYFALEGEFVGHMAYTHHALHRAAWALQEEEPSPGNTWAREDD